MNMSESQIIERLRLAADHAGLASSRVRLGMGDDAALFAPRNGYQTILTCDWFLERTHFVRGLHPADAVGWKCLARAVSDIAAMGGEPKCFLLSLALPETHTGRWLGEFLAGLRRAARKFQCPLAGGDTTRRREVLVNVMVVGEVRTGQAVLRSGATPGEVLFVSGSLGEADWGLKLLRGGKRRLRNDPAVEKHLYPEPRIALGRWLSSRKLATAMMDLSDGLSSDLPRLCAASKAGARIAAAQLPTLRLTRTPTERFDPMALALNGGDDYELLFTVRPSKVRLIPTYFQRIPLTRIGEITPGRKLKLVRPDGREEELVSRGWDPFWS